MVRELRLVNWLSKVLRQMILSFFGKFNPCVLFKTLNTIATLQNNWIRNSGLCYNNCMFWNSIGDTGVQPRFRSTVRILELMKIYLELCKNLEFFPPLSFLPFLPACLPPSLSPFLLSLPPSLLPSFLPSVSGRSELTPLKLYIALCYDKKMIGNIIKVKIL